MNTVENEISKKSLLWRIMYGSPFRDKCNQPRATEKELGLCRIASEVLWGSLSWIWFVGSIITVIALVIGFVVCIGFGLHALYILSGDSPKNFEQSSVTSWLLSGLGMIIIGLVAVIFGLGFLWTIIRHVVVAEIAKTKPGQAVAAFCIAIKQKTCPKFKIVA